MWVTALALWTISVIVVGPHVVSCIEFTAGCQITMEEADCYETVLKQEVCIIGGDCKCNGNQMEKAVVDCLSVSIFSAGSKRQCNNCKSCSNGWKHINGNNCQAICRDGCVKANAHECTAAFECRCLDGWSGSTCNEKCKHPPGCDTVVRCSAPWGMDDTQCGSCKPGYVHDSVTKRCTPCPPGKKCEGGVVTGTCPEDTFAPGTSSQCFPCPAGSTSFFESAKCDCPDGETLNDEETACKPCPAGFKCFAGFTKKCPELQTSEEGATRCHCVHNAIDNGIGCDACFERCWNCNGTATTDCQKCTAPWFKSHRLCVEGGDCPFGQYPDEALRRCEPCHRECDGCTGQYVSDCINCKNVKFEGSCRSVCPPKFYTDANRVCQRCDSSCDTCRGPNAKDCVDCANASLRDRNGTVSCVDECPSGFYANNRFCFPCTAEHCTSCGTKKGVGQPIFAQDECVACASGYEVNEDRECVNVDECEDDAMHDCVDRKAGGACADTEGSYECSCAAGYDGGGGGVSIKHDQANMQGYSRDSTVETFDNPMVNRSSDMHSTTGLVMTNNVVDP